MLSASRLRPASDPLRPASACRQWKIEEYTPNCQSEETSCDYQTVLWCYRPLTIPLATSKRDLAGTQEVDPNNKLNPNTLGTPFLLLVLVVIYFCLLFMLLCN